MKSPILNRRSFVSLGKALRSAPALRGRQIDGQLRELIILRVSSVNGCPVCSFAHGFFGRASGLTDDEIRRARECGEPQGFDARTQAALEYAEAYTLAATSSAPALIEASAKLMEHFDANAQREIHVFIDFFVFMNRLNNTWERWLPGAEGRRSKLGLCPCEQSD